MNNRIFQIRSCVVTILLLILFSCANEDPILVYKGDSLSHFPSTKGSYFVFQSSDPGFDLMAGITKAQGVARTINVTIDASKSTAVEGVHFTMPSKQITIEPNKVVGSVKINGIFAALTSSKKLVLNISSSDNPAGFSTAYELTLQQFCPYKQSDFVGTWQFTSDPDMFDDTWTVQIIAGASPNELIVKDLYNQGYDTPARDIILKLDDSDPANFKVTVTKQAAWNTAMFGLSYGIASIAGSGSFSSCNKTMNIFLTHTVAAGPFGTFEEKFVKL